MTGPYDIDEQAIRRRVEAEFNKRAEFNIHLVIFIIINIIIWLGWQALRGAIPGIPDVPWPILVTGGWGAGLIAHRMEVFYNTGARAAAREGAVQEALVDRLGYDWRETADKRQVSAISHKAAEPFNERKEFFMHLAIYLIVNFALGLFWITGIGPLTHIDFPILPVVSMLGWGIGLAAHGAKVYFGSAMADSREEAVAREVERERERLYGTTKAKRKAKNDEWQLTDDGELEPVDDSLYEIEDEEQKHQYG